MTLHYQWESGTAHDITTSVTALRHTTTRQGQPGKLELTALVNDLQWHPGGLLSLWDDQGRGVFYGYVFRVQVSEEGQVAVTAYDQLRYLKNRDSYYFQQMRADQIVREIAEDFKLRLGSLEPTGYVIPALVEDGQTLFDIILEALDQTYEATGRFFALWDDFGALRLSDVMEHILPLKLGDGSLATGFGYESQIDSGVTNRVRLFTESKAAGRQLFEAENTGSQARYGVLQRYQRAPAGLSEGQLRALVSSMLSSSGEPSLTLSVNALLEPTVRAGCILYAQLAELGLDRYLMVEQAVLDYMEGTMKLTLRVPKGGL